MQGQKASNPCQHYTDFHLSIHCLSGSKSWRQQAKQGSSDICLPSHVQFFLGIDFQSLFNLQMPMDNIFWLIHYLMTPYTDDPIKQILPKGSVLFEVFLQPNLFSPVWYLQREEGIISYLLQAVKVKYKIIQTQANVKFYIKMNEKKRHYTISLQTIQEYLQCFHGESSWLWSYCRSVEVSTTAYKFVELACSQCITMQRARK